MTLQLHLDDLKGSENYMAWAMTMQAYFESENLWEVVQNGPLNTKESVRKDKRAKFTMLSALDECIFKGLGCEKTASDLWDYLKESYSSLM